MINCPDCKSNELVVINSRLTLSGGYIKRRLKCGCCDARFTSHEIREVDLADSSPNHFDHVLRKIRNNARIPRVFQDAIKPRPSVISLSFMQRVRKISPCCFSSNSGEL